MPPIRTGLILNEPPLPELSAATRSSAAMVSVFEKMQSSETNSIVNLEKVWAVSADINQHQNAIGQFYPDFHRKIQLVPAGSGDRLLDRCRNVLWPMSYALGLYLKREIAQAVYKGKFNLLHVEQLWPVYAVPADFSVNHVLVNPHFFLRTDMQSAEPPATRREAFFRARLVQAEASLIRKFRCFRVLSPEMAATLAEIHPKAEIHVVPLPIDSAAYEFQLRDRIPDEPIVTCIGSMFWPPSRAAAERLITRLWPEIQKELPRARLQVVGRDAMKYFSSFHHKNRIEIIENVPDITPFFLNSSLLVYAPPEGSGMKVKVQESMLHGLPVVVNHAGAEGLNIRDGHDAMIAETDAEIVSASVAVLKSPDLSGRLSSNGRKLITSQCGPERVVQELISIYEKMMVNE